MAHSDSVEGSFAGQTFRLQGRESIYLMITLLALVAVGFMLWQSLDRSAVEHRDLGQAMGTLNETMQEQNYIITLPDEDRKALKLSMPRSLREKTLERR